MLDRRGRSGPHPLGKKPAHHSKVERKKEILRLPNTVLTKLEYSLPSKGSKNLTEWNDG